MAGLYDETIQIVTCREDLHSVEDLKGLRVCVGDAGSGAEFNARQILSAYGLKFSNIQKVNASFGDSAAALSAGAIDAAFVVAGAPTKAVSELAEKNAVHLIGLDKEHISALQEQYGFYTETLVPADTYKGLSGEVDTVSIRATLVANNRLSEDIVYELLGGLFAEQDALAKGEPKFSGLSLSDAVKGISIPFHTGAARFYSEQGAEGF